MIKDLPPCLNDALTSDNLDTRYKAIVMSVSYLKYDLKIDPEAIYHKLVRHSKNFKLRKIIVETTKHYTCKDFKLVSKCTDKCPKVKKEVSKKEKKPSEIIEYVINNTDSVNIRPYKDINESEYIVTINSQIFKTELKTLKNYNDFQLFFYHNFGVFLPLNKDIWYKILEAWHEMAIVEKTVEYSSLDSALSVVINELTMRRRAYNFSDLVVNDRIDPSIICMRDNCLYVHPQLIKEIADRNKLPFTQSALIKELKDKNYITDTSPRKVGNSTVRLLVFDADKLGIQKVEIEEEEKNEDI